jgi:hypothetical protein
MQADNKTDFLNTLLVMVYFWLSVFLLRSSASTLRIARQSCAREHRQHKREANGNEMLVLNNDTRQPIYQYPVRHTHPRSDIPEFEDRVRSVVVASRSISSDNDRVSPAPVS